MVLVGYLLMATALGCCLFVVNLPKKYWVRGLWSKSGLVVRAFAEKGFDIEEYSGHEEAYCDEDENGILYLWVRQNERNDKLIYRVEQGTLYLTWMGNRPIPEFDQYGIPHSWPGWTYLKLRQNFNKVELKLTGPYRTRMNSMGYYNSEALLYP